MTDKERIKLLEDKIKNLHEGYRKQLLNLEKFKAMVMNLNLGLMVVDNVEIITKVYSSFESLTGYTAEELVGKKASEVLLRKGRCHFRSSAQGTALASKTVILVFMKFQSSLKTARNCG